MKKILTGLTLGITLMLVLAATNLPQSWTWNSTLNAFQVLMKDGGGTKFVPTLNTLGANTGLLASGTYTPSLTNVQNFANLGVRGAHYLRVGNIVTVTMWAYCNLTGPSASIFDMTLPISTSGTAQGDVIGVVGGDNVFVRGEVIGGTGKARVYAYSGSGTNGTELTVMFTYRIY